MRKLHAVLWASAFAAGCGEPAATPGEDVLGTGPLLPWKAGHRWTYRVTDEGTVSEKVTTVGELEPVGGTGPSKDVMANKVLTLKGASDRTVSWQAASGTRIVRYREQAFRASTGALELEEHWEPAKLHVDEAPEHVEAGASWLEIYQETKQEEGLAATTATARDRWTVLAVGEPVTVPAGTFNALVLQKAGGSTSKTYWYVRGVGKVKEIGGQTEELVSFELAP